MVKLVSLELQLDHQVSELDRLIAEVRGGVRSATHFDELEERANEIGKGIRDAFRTRAR